MNEQPTNSPTTPIQKASGMLSTVSAPLAFLFGVVTTVAVFSFFGLIGLGIILMNDGSEKPKTNTNKTNTSATNTNTAASLQSSIDPKSIRYTKGSGSLTFIEYTDLECPYCKDFHPEISTLAEKYSGKVAFTTKHFPLNRHPKAEREAGAAECAGRQGKFFEYMDEIFAVTPSNNLLEDAELFTAAEKLGLNMTDFRSCVDSEGYLEVVAADAIEAQAVGATGTPFSILIDADGNILTRFKGVLNATQLSQALDQFLAQQ